MLLVQAHKIKKPLLLLHGADDDNSGTFPLQSERFYAALKGHGAPCKLVHPSPCLAQEQFVLCWQTNAACPISSLLHVAGKVSIQCLESEATLTAGLSRLCRIWTSVTLCIVQSICGRVTCMLACHHPGCVISLGCAFDATGCGMQCWHCCQPCIMLH